MRNVAVMPDPVEELPAADVVVPAPVHVNARLDVRLHRRRAEPAVVVEAGRRLGNCHVPAGLRRGELGEAPGRTVHLRQLLQQLGSGSGKVGVAAGKAHFDAGDLADETVLHDLDRLVEILD